MIAPSNTVVFSRKAARQLRKFPTADSLRILARCAELQHFPACAHVKPLVNHTYGYRLRVGNYRVLFDVDDVVHVVSIEEVKKRDDRTY